MEAPHLLGGLGALGPPLSVARNGAVPGRPQQVVQSADWRPVLGDDLEAPTRELSETSRLLDLLVRILRVGCLVTPIVFIEAERGSLHPQPSSAHSCLS